MEPILLYYPRKRVASPLGKKTSQTLSRIWTSSSLPITVRRPPQPALLFLLCLPLVIFLSSCETLSARLDRNLETLHSLPADHQTFIRQGTIKIGFTPVEVYLAWGAPDHKALTENTQGSLETWVYTQTYTETHYRQRRVYDTSSEKWEYIDKPYQVHSRYLVKEAVFLDGKLDSFTLFPSSARPYR